MHNFYPFASGPGTPGRLTAILLTIMATSTIFSACHGLDCVEGSGEVRSESRQVPGFSGVVIEGSMDLILTQDSTQSLRVEAEENILPLITTTVTNGTLTIDNKGCIMTSKGIKVYASIPQVHLIRIEGSGDATATGKIRTSAIDLAIEGSGSITMDVESDNISSTIEGSGDVNLSGKSGTHTVVINGSGDLSAEEMPVGNCSITVDGSGDCYVNVLDTLNVEISGSGDVYYKGNPAAVNTKIDGSGSVSKRP